METPKIIYLVVDREDPSNIVWQSTQPTKDGVEYIRSDLVDTYKPFTIRKEFFEETY